MDRTYSKAELDYLNTKYGRWIRYPQKEEKDYVLYATGDANISCGRIYVALSKGPLSYEDKIKYNIM